ncbi:MAG: hypothetical protein JWO31_3378, partial [Phycisphaerales bacterium]|nr:hypothetical protein [Phycisphaerales bacterium]
ESEQTTGVIRALGVREVMHGIDLLAHPDPTAGVRARIAGDLLDGAALVAAARKTRRPSGLALVAAAVLPIVLADLLIYRRLRHRRQ